MTNKRFITAKDVVEELGVSTSYAYKLIRELNTERAADGFVTKEVDFRWKERLVL
ncbi:hypothetical protein [Agathobacter sp.]|uniref:hypothetical protein n=1 Tax=Agathobacter sp. TaxID=2021311 RepID=UPI00280BF53F|nr:hypothetical protein [Agathobacter sp.]